MSGYLKKTLWVLTALVTMGALAACGGGGGATVAASDTGPAYKGISSQAKIKEDNAVDLAFGGYAGGNLGSSLGWRGMAKTTTEAPAPAAPNLSQLTSALKTSMLQLMASDATRLQKDAFSAKVLRRAETFDVPGWFGGVASYSMDVNDATGSFSGTVRFVDFATDLYTFSGSADITGSVDTSQQAIKLLTLSFKPLKVTSGYTLDLTGSISWTFDLSAPADSMAMNMVLLDEFSGKTFWFKDYIVKSTYGYASMTQDISGRYFDPDHGFVDFVTDATIVFDYLYEWPIQGAITFSGSGRTSVRLSFEQDRIVIGADLDGDTIVDVQDQLLLYPLEPYSASTESGSILTMDQPPLPDLELMDNGDNGDNSDKNEYNGSNGPDESSPIHNDSGHSPDMEVPQQ